VVFLFSSLNDLCLHVKIRYPGVFGVLENAIHLISWNFPGNCSPTRSPVNLTEDPELTLNIQNAVYGDSLPPTTPSTTPALR
jgi:hypothetical protein